MELNALKNILIEVFPNATIPNNIKELKMGDIDDWDSLGNFNLLLRIEEVFEIRFSVDEMSNIKSVAQIIDYLIST